MKVKLFTHNDLDGVGCAIVARLAYGDVVDVEYCDYKNVNEKVSAFILNEEYIWYDNIFITDISINHETAGMINKELHKMSASLQLLDHHDSAIWLDERYDWCTVNSNIPSDSYITAWNIGSKACGTQMLYMELADMVRHDISNNVFGFVELVRQYDTWEWKELYFNDTPKHLNGLLGLYGKDLFVNVIINRIRANEALISSTDMFMLDMEQKKIDRYIESKQKVMVTRECFGKPVGVVFAEQYQSELGNALSANNPDLEFIVLIDPSKSISFRTIFDDIHLGNDVAKLYGGGGHAKAAGAVISESVKEVLIDTILWTGINTSD